MNAFSYAAGRRVFLIVGVCASCLAFSSPRLAAASVSENVPVPGGTAELSRALGLDTAPEPARFVTQIIRVIYDTPDGTTSSTEALSRKLTSYLRLTGATGTRARAPVDIVQTDTVPVPLSAKVWSDTVFHRPVDVAALFAAIIADRRAALLCFGLAALDDETLQLLSDHTALLRR
jgi:hypothetical protein